MQTPVRSLATNSSNSSNSSNEPSEARLYRLLEEKLPATTIVSIGHRSTLEAFHQQYIVLTRQGDRFTLQHGAKSVAAE